MSDLIDEESLTSETFQIPEGFLPKGNWWDADGACYTAVHCDSASDGICWRWQPRNAKALAKGYHGQELFPFFFPTGHKP